MRQFSATSPRKSSADIDVSWATALSYLCAVLLKNYNRKSSSKVGCVAIYTHPQSNNKTQSKGNFQTFALFGIRSLTDADIATIDPL